MSLVMLYSHPVALEVPSHIKNNKLFHALPIEPNRFFEGAMFRKELPGDTDWIGHVAYSYPKKIPAYDFEDLIKKYEDYDIITLMPGLMHDFYQHAEMYHPGFLEIWARLLELMGFEDYRKLSKPTPFYCNYWIAKRTWFDKYRTIALRAMKLLEEDPILNELAEKDSNYKGTLLRLPADKLIQISGKPYYTFHPFIIERLVCFFAMVDGAKIKHVTAVEAADAPRRTYADENIEGVHAVKVKKDRKVML